MKDNDIRSFFGTKQIKEKSNTNQTNQTVTPTIKIQEKQPSPQKISEITKSSKKRKCAEV